MQVVVAEGAPRYDGHLMARKLAAAGVQTTVIADCAVFAMMARANKVGMWWKPLSLVHVLVVVVLTGICVRGGPAIALGCRTSTVAHVAIAQATHSPSLGSICMRIVHSCLHRVGPLSRVCKWRGDCASGHPCVVRCNLLSSAPPVYVLVVAHAVLGTGDAIAPVGGGIGCKLSLTTLVTMSVLYAHWCWWGPLPCLPMEG